ncbi:alpha/beta hydrolase [Streptomyces sp. NPDC021356]|uniref:alpha/beta hydrolase n=1 Tax=Streptomyces sp. NPDC021356 TaxID=3154900 RepID=UPI0033FE1231
MVGIGERLVPDRARTAVRRRSRGAPARSQDARPAGPVGSAAPRRRAAAWLPVLAVVLALTAGTGCDVGGASGPGSGPGASGAGHRTGAEAPSPPPGLPAAFTTGQRLRWAACPAPSPAHGKGGGWQCATMKAPLDHRRPGRGTIDVALIRKRATGADHERIGSLVFDFGGPGESGVTGLPEYADDYTKLGERYDLVGFDPRGVGRSAPVRCGRTEFESGDACEKYSGRILPYVTTSQTARDLDLLRYLLGDGKLNYFGISYGTELGGVYAHLFPKNVGRAVLEAPVDPTQDRLQEELSQVKAVQSAFDRFARHCARTYDDCPTGSDPEQADRRVTALLDRLRDKPARTDGGEELDADLAAHAISNHLDLGEDGWEPLVKALDEVMRRGTGNALLREAYDHAPGARAKRLTGARTGTSTVAEAGTGPAAPDDNSVSAYVAITCADSSSRPGFTEAEDMVKRIEAASPVFGEAWSSAVYLCYDWPVKGERAAPDVRADGASPILVVAGTGDPTTPYAGGERMAAELGAKVGVLLTVRAEGHGTYPYDDCAIEAVDAYLLDGTPPARGTTCS